ncbi:MAG: septum site-determining protein MinC [Burkholderiales bacterium]|nr:septum site-determining protein MinC [Burkholderiales bacterium]
MAADPSGRTRASFDLKSATYPLLSLVLKTTDLADVLAELQARLGGSPDFFDQDLVVINLSQVREAAGDINFSALIALLRQYRLQPIGAHGGSQAQMLGALAAGLVATPDVSASSSLARSARGSQSHADEEREAAASGELAVSGEAAASDEVAASSTGSASVAADEPAASGAAAAQAGAADPVQAELAGMTTTDTATDANGAVAAVAAPAPAASSHAAPSPPSSPPAPAARTIVIDRPLRSGQRVYARDADLVMLAVVSFGAEVIADGNIHVYAPLRGRAIAGARGNTDARIFTTCLEPQLVSIAGIYRTAEVAMPPEVASKPAQIRLVGETLLMEPL